MSTDRLNPDPNADYGKCTTCEIPLPTEQEARDHMHATLKAASAAGGVKGHSIRVQNPPRAKRVEREIGWIVDAAIQDAMSGIDDLIACGDITEDEAKAGLTWHADFSDAWDEYNK